MPLLLPRPRSPLSGEELLGRTRFSTRGGCSSSAASGLCSPAAGTRCYGLSTTTAVLNAQSPLPSYIPSNHIPVIPLSIPLNHWWVASSSRAAVVAKCPLPNMTRGLSSCFSHGSVAATLQSEIFPTVHSVLALLPSPLLLQPHLLLLHPPFSQPQL